MYLIKKIKKIFLVSNFIFGLIVTIPVQAQEITAIDFNGSPIGKVIPDGKVVSFDNKLLGNVTADSLIVDSKGELIGGVVPQGVAIGNDAKFLGKVGNDGSVRSATGQVIGKSLPNGLVVNEYFEILGQIIFPGLVYNDEGKISGRVTGDGLYTNLAGVQIGIVTPDGYAYRKVGNDYILDGRLISSKMVISLNGEFIGSVVPGGQVTDFNSEPIGSVKANGFVYNSSNEIIGRIVSSGYAFDNNGYYLGFVSYNGEVIYNNKVVGKARADKMIVNINGLIVGRQIDFAATATDLNGRYLGRLLPDGKLAKAETSSGLAGARGVIFDASGLPIGSLIKTGPIYDYKGELKGHALSNGAVISLNGTTIGYMIGGNAYNLSGIIMGAVLPSKVVYSSNDTFIGLTGISSYIDNKGSKYSVSPFGYVFAQSGAVEGKAKNIDTFYTPFGSVSGYQGLNGRVFNPKGADIGRVGGFGFVLNSQNQMIAKNIEDFLTINYQGQSIGMLNDENMVLNKSLSAIAKILPDSSVSEIKSGNLNYMPKIGQAYTGNIALDFRGGFLGYANILGGINNSSGAKIGHVVGQSLVVDNNGIVVGSLFDYQGAVNDKCEFLGVISSQGGIYNYRDVYVGKILSNGIVISDSGSKLGYTVPKSSVIDFNGRIIGYTDYSGKVNNERGEVIGCLDIRHQLRNADNALIGSAISFDSAIAFDGEIIGYSTINGLVVDKNNDLIAYQQPNGNINSNSGIPLGMLFKYKVAFNFDNKFIGYVTKNGLVIDAQNNEIGKVDFEGYVTSSKDKIGYALYDFYVYDAKGQVVGIISRNGDVSSFTNQNIGVFDRGFVLKGNEIIARGNRDYNIRDKERKVIGELQLDGKVLDNINNHVGTLSIDGKIKNANDEIIAAASPLQYYTSEHSAKKRQMIFDENGNFLGYLDENGNLVDANGNIIGRLDENGNIVDMNGNIIAQLDKNGNLVTNKKRQMIFDENGNFLGYLDENGNLVDANGNIIGRLDENGNIVNKDGNIVTHKKRQMIFDENGNFLGYLDENGNLVDANGNIIGRLDENGNIVDMNGNIIAQLDKNGNLVDANGNIIGRVNRQWFDKNSIIGITGTQSVVEEDVSPDLELFEDRKYLKSLGIALTPDGEYLGDILEDDSVVDDKGNIIGYRMPDGLIIDQDGNLIGTEEFDDIAELEDGNVFVPAGSFGPGGAYGVGSGNAGNLGPGGGYGPGERYDPTRQAALNAAMQERRQNISVGKISSGIRKEAFDGYQKDWSEQGIPKSISSWRVDMTEMIFSDKPIPAVIARAIDTNNPAPVTAYVERNVYAEEGRNIIIPSGSRLIGSFGSITAAAEATSESARVQISWERLIRPDGSIFVFSGQTADAQGRAGALGYVDQQLFKKYTMPVVTTVLTSAASFFIAAAEDNAGQVENSKQQAANDARQNFLSDMESLFDDILADKTDVKAMTYIPAGTRIVVYPNTDLWLRSVERDNEETMKLQQPEVLIDDAEMLQKTKQQEREKVAKSAGGSVVYDPDEVDAKSAGNTATPLIDDTAAKKTNTIAPPPPPTGGNLPVAGSTPSVTTTTTSESSNNSIPALF